MSHTETRGLVLDEKLLFELSDPGRVGFSLPELDVPAMLPDETLCREELTDFPELSEVDVVRHYTRLSTWNYGVDSGFYPLGSCTMKYNPKLNEQAARLAGFAELHPHTPDHLSQGALGFPALASSRHASRWAALAPRPTPDGAGSPWRCYSCVGPPCPGTARRRRVVRLSRR